MDRLSTGIDLIDFFSLARASTEEFLEAFRVYAERRGDTLPYPTLQALVDYGQMLERLQESYTRYIAEGSTEFDPLYLAKLENRETIRQLLVDLMDKYQLDALVYPFKALAAPPLGTSDRGPRDNPISAITGLPALVVPAGVNSEGLPISIEFLGRPFSEQVLFSLGYGYEQAIHHRITPDTTLPLRGEEISF